MTQLDSEIFHTLRRRSILASATILVIAGIYYYLASANHLLHRFDEIALPAIAVVALIRMYFGIKIFKFGLNPVRIFTCLSGSGWGIIFLHNLYLSNGNVLANRESFFSLFLMIGFAGNSTALAVDKILGQGFLVFTVLPAALGTLFFPEAHFLTVPLFFFFVWVFSNLRSYSIQFLERKKQLEETIKKQTLLSTIIESVPGYVSLFDKNLVYLEINQALLAELKLKSSDVIGKPLDFLNTKNELIQSIVDYQKSPNTKSLGLKLKYAISPHEEPKWFYTSLSRATGGEIACISIDIHEQETNEQLIHDQQQKIIHSKHLAEIGELLGGVAHEINNPLQAILMTLGTLESICEENGPQYQEITKHVERLKKFSLRIKKLVSSVKNQVRKGDGDKFEKFNLNEIIDEAVLILGYKLKSSEIELQLDLQKDLTLVGRSIEIGQVILNLVNNAIEAIEKNPIKWIRIEGKSDGLVVELRVIDSGNGIPKEHLDKIMDSFFTTKAVGVGTGIGLSICKKIAVDHKGSFEIDANCPNTCFVLRIPYPKQDGIAA